MEEHLKKWNPVVNGDGSYTTGELVFDPGSNPLEIALGTFRFATDDEQREWAFWEFARLAWSRDGGLGLVSEDLLIWNPWTASHIREFCRERTVAIGGSANSTKSHSAAAWGIANWLCDPENVLVLITSTSIKAAKDRVWKSVDRLLTPLVAAGVAPTKLRADGTAPFNRPDKTVFDGAGLKLVAGSKDSDRESTSKLIGIKASPEVRKIGGRRLVRPRLIIIADELSELSAAIVGSLANLRSQKPQFIGLSNPRSQHDPFGEVAEPEGGWDSVDLLNDHRWRTRTGGVYIRMDCERSPNLEYPPDEEPWEFLPGREDLMEMTDRYGPNSSGYLRFGRAVFFAAAGGQGIYSKTELRKAGAMDKDVVFKGPVTRLAACDPSETDDGDKTPVMFATLGWTEERKHVLRIDETIYLTSDDSDPETPREYQIMRQLKDLCEEREVSPEHVAVDDTMSAWVAILTMEWSPGVYAVDSNSRATDRPQFANVNLTNRELYASRVAEMWHEPRAFFRHGQLKGLPNAAVEQFTTRGISYGLHGTGRSLGLEAKPKYRKRTGSSPDEADTVCMLVDLAITRLGFRPGFEAVAKGPDVGKCGIFWDLGMPFSAFDVAGRSSDAWI